LIFGILFDILENISFNLGVKKVGYKKRKLNKEENKKTKKKHRILKAFLFILLMIVLFIGGFLGYSVYKNGWGLKGVLQTMTGQSEEALKDLEEFKVLILGISEDISVKLTDTIMVASYNPRTQKAVLLSIPRDTYVGKNRNTANSYDKINALYQVGGAKTTLDAVNELTGLNIKYYVVISNNALVDLVDEIGGVKFDVPINMDYDSKGQGLHIHLKKGMQTLTGEQAEGLVRFRHNNDGSSYPSEYGDNDYGRMKTQREFIKAVAKQTIQFKNITKIGGLIDIVKRNVKTNIKDWNTIKDYIPYAVEFNMDNLQTETLPGVSNRIPANTGLWFFEHSESKTEDLIEKLYSEPKEEESINTNSSMNQNTSTSDVEIISNVKIELLNGSGDKTLLTKVTNKLKKAGYIVYKTGTTSNTAKTTIVNKNSIEEKTLSDIKDILKVGVISNSSISSETVDVTIVLGKDYNG